MLLKSILRGAFSFSCLLSGCSRKMVDNVVVGLTVVVVGLTVVCTGVDSVAGWAPQGVGVLGAVSNVL